MSIWIKVIALVLCVATVSLICPPKLEAQSPQGNTDPQLSELSKSSLLMAMGMIDPALSSAFTNLGASKDTASPDVDQADNNTLVQPPTPITSSPPGPKLDVDALIAAAPQSPRAGLTLVTRQNTWDTQPQNNADMIACVDEDSVQEDGWSGAGIVSEIDQTENLYGNSDNYTAYYETFFYADTAGTWSFATDSVGASEIEIDGDAIAAWYGQHEAAGDWSHYGNADLSGGWHRLVYRYAQIASVPAARAAFMKPGGLDWNVLGKATLTLKAVNLDAGLLLTTGTNTWKTHPQNHNELADCVETGAGDNATATISSIVESLYQNKNLYAAVDNYTSCYETFFYADRVGTWSFATNSVQASEIEIDENVVASWYGDHMPAIDWSHSGSVVLTRGWHRLVYRYEYVAGGPFNWSEPLASAAFKKPGDSEWSDLSTANLSLKGPCRVGIDGDNLPDSVEAVLGTDPAGMDSDGDLLDDYFEARNGLDPLKADSNGDGVYDYFEVNNAASQDIDQDGIPNAWDDDNDGDGVPDSEDSSPFAQSVVSSQFQFHIQSDGSPTYAEFQVRPNDPTHLKLDTQTWDWPDDSQGSMQDLDKSKDDIQINPMLELTLDQPLKASEVKDYGITVADQSVSFEGDSPWSPDLFSPPLGWETAGGGAAFADINGNGIPDLVLTNIDDPRGNSHFRYIIGWDIQADGQPVSWGSASSCPTTLGWTRINQDLNDGAGGQFIFLSVKEPLVDQIRVIKGFSSPGSGWTKIDQDLNAGAGGGYIYLWVKDALRDQIKVISGFSTPAGSGWNKIDNDLNEGAGGDYIYLWVKDALLGQIEVISSGSSDVQPYQATPAGSGAAITDINGNGKPDLVLMDLDASNGADQLRYVIGWDLTAAGVVTSWSSIFWPGSLGDSNSGASAAIADINGNGKPDLLLMGIDDPDGANQFRYRIGWDLAADGKTANWSSVRKSPEIAYYTAGGGASIADIDGNGVDDLVLMAVDSTTRGNRFEYMIGWNLDKNGNPSNWSPALYQGWTKIQQDLNAGAGGQFIYLCVKEHMEGLIKVISGDSSGITPGAGWTKLPEDLNSGAGGQHIYLCVKGSLVDQVKIISGSSASISPGAGWTRLSQDLNEGAGGQYIYLCVKNNLAGQFKVVSSSSADITSDLDIQPCGAGMAVADIDGNGFPELFLVSLDEQPQADNFHYVVGRDMRTATKVYVPLLPVDDNGSTVAYNGKMFFPAQTAPLDVSLAAKLVWMVKGKSDLTGVTWGSMTGKGGLGNSDSGGGAAIADINGNGVPDLLLMGIDNPEGSDSFRYTIGWDMGSSGQPASWSNIFSKSGLGWDNSGGGAAIADLNGNGIPDLLLMGIDNPDGADFFRYVIGWDMSSSGQPASWSSTFSKVGLGNDDSGGGAAIADVNGNGIPDLLLMGIDNPDGSDSFRYMIGWDLGSSGQPASWSGTFSKGGLGNDDSGGGAAIADVNGNGIPDLLLMGIDNADGGDSFRYVIGWDLSSSGQPASWSNILTKDGLGSHNSGGGAAIADLNGDGIPDLLLMGIDDPDGSNSFRYTTGTNFTTENRVLARYNEDFKLTGFSVTENHGCEAGLFYSPDKDETTRGYLALRDEFLNSQNSLTQARNNLGQWDVSLISDVRSFAHQDLAAAALTGDMISKALDRMPQHSKIPVAIAMSDNSRTLGMDNLVTGSYILNNSFDIDMAQTSQMTFKSIKLPWYNTGTRELMDDVDLMSEINNWDWEDEAKANLTVPLLYWNYGETNTTRLDDYSISTGEAENSRLKAYLQQNHNILHDIGYYFSLPMRGLLLSGMIGPLKDFPHSFGKGFRTAIWGFRLFYKKGELSRSLYHAGVRTQIMASTDTVNTFNPLRRAVRGTPRQFGRDNRPALKLGSKFNVSYAKWVRVLKVVGRVMIVASLLLIIGEFIYAGAKSGWTRLGMGVAGLYAAMELVYLGLMIAIACIPIVGWVISLVILVADFIASCFGYGSGWIMEKIIDGLVDINLRSDTSLDTIDTSIGLTDYEDNGLTSGDLIEMSSRIRETVEEKGEGNSGDVEDSYNTPYYAYSVSGAAQSGGFRNTVSHNNQGGWRSVIHETGVWVMPQARVNLPLTVWLHSDYRVYYDETIVGINEVKSESGSTDSDPSHLYFDVLPGSLDEFLTWSAITSQDRDGDNLNDTVEAGASVNTSYQLSNQDSDLSLSTEAASGSSQAEAALYSGLANQKWYLTSELTGSNCALMASNGKYIKADTDTTHNPLILGAFAGSIQDALKFQVLNLDENHVALKTGNGQLVVSDRTYYLYAYGTKLIPEACFEVTYLDAGTFALKASNGKYVSSADTVDVPNQLRATADSIGVNETFTLAQSGCYQVHATSDGKVLSISDGSITGGAGVVTKSYGYFSDQNWSFESTGDGYYRIVNQRSGLCLGINGEVVNGAHAIQETYTGASDQKWKLQPVYASTNSTKWDTDADGLPDGFEVRNSVEIGTSATLADTDNDGLNDRLELDLGTSPISSDSDADNLADKTEITGWIVNFTFNGKTFTEQVCSDPLTVDTDGDGLTDYQEYRNHFNPRSKDTDGDGIADPDEAGVIISSTGAQDILASPQLEFGDDDWDRDNLTDQAEEIGWDINFIDSQGGQTVHVSSDPLAPDTDYDGLNDSAEYTLHTNPASVDTDNDSLSDRLEQQLGTLPNNYDTDGDGLDDGTEVTLGSDPFTPDSDGDNLTDLEEFALGSSPLKSDTDSDNLTDYQEVQAGTVLTNPDSDGDLLIDGDEINLGANPLISDSDGDGVSDGLEVIAGTDPLSADSDNDGLSDADEKELWTNPLDVDSDGDGLTDLQEVQQGSNPLSEDSDNDGIKDAADIDSSMANVDKVYVLYDANNSDYNQFIKGLSQYTQVISGTPADIPDYQQKPYVVVLGYPENTDNDTAAKITYNILTADVRADMLKSDLDRMVRGVNIWEGNSMVICLSRPYHSDYFRVLASLKGLKSEVTDNSLSLTYPEAKKSFFLEAIKEVDFYFEVNLIQQVTPSITITRFNEATTPRTLNYASGLGGNELPVGKYMQIDVSQNVQSSTLDNIQNALFKIYYTAAELDRSAPKDGDCADAGDINENTLCLYRWNAAAGKWEKLADLSDVNDSGVNSANVKPYATDYEGYVWADVGHFSLYALAGKAIPAPPAYQVPYTAPVETPAPTLTVVPTIIPSLSSTSVPSPGLTATPAPVPTQTASPTVTATPVSPVITPFSESMPTPAQTISVVPTITTLPKAATPWMLIIIVVLGLGTILGIILTILRARKTKPK